MADEPSTPEPPRKFGRVDRSPLKVSPWWRVAAIALVVLVIIVGLSVAAFETPAPKTLSTLTKVEWYNYQVTAGPGIDTNVTAIRGMCAPSGAVTVPIFSMVWNTSTGKPVQLVRIWTVEGGNPAVVNLYKAVNSSSGGTSFLSEPYLCEGPWVLTAASNQTVTVNAIATLSYNYTA
jgi:hypothetical protein